MVVKINKVQLNNKTRIILKIKIIKKSAKKLPTKIKIK